MTKTHIFRSAIASLLFTTAGFVLANTVCGLTNPYQIVVGGTSCDPNAPPEDYCAPDTVEPGSCTVTGGGNYCTNENESVPYYNRGCETTDGVTTCVQTQKSEDVDSPEKGSACSG